MIFKDRQDAGEKLAEIIKNDPYIKRRLVRSRILVVSLLRGGIIVGDIIAKKLKIGHLPLIVAKIQAPSNPELALGALCFDMVFLEKKIISSLDIDKATIQNQIIQAKKKFIDYQRRFSLHEEQFNHLKNYHLILVDDGIATGATVKAALLFLKSKKPRKIFLAVPVAPIDFEEKNFDKALIIHKNPYFSSVSQFYDNFFQVDDKKVKKLINRSTIK